MKKINILDIDIQNDSIKKVLYTIIKNIPPEQFFHIVSLNPEILVETQKNKTFKDIVKTAQINIVDGVGVALTIQTLFRIPCKRITGVDLMEQVLKYAGKNSLRVVFIGGTTYLAESIAKCYQEKYPKAVFTGLQAIKNIKKPTTAEMDNISSIVTDVRPHFVFAAFGSPYQEIWLWNNRKLFSSSICMGVGQGFDVLGGHINRAPLWIRNIGFEWLYRLVSQPWRWKRQLKLPLFVFLVIKEYIYGNLFSKKD